MTLTYPYIKLPGKKGAKIKTPSIRIDLNGNSSLKLSNVALVDSGADISLIPKGLAEVLNLDLSGNKSLSYGVSGKEIECIESKLKITLSKNHQRFDITLPVLVSPNDECPVLLGRNGFFDKFKITFDNKNQNTILKEYPNKR